MTTLLLVRHAETDAQSDLLLGRDDEVRLSTRGLERAAKLARHLRRLPIAALWSSPLRRAIQTAATPIMEQVAISIELRSRSMKSITADGPGAASPTSRVIQAGAVSTPCVTASRFRKERRSGRWSDE